MLKYLVYLSGLMLVVYNLHSGLTAQEIGFLGLDIKFVRTGEAVQAEPAVGLPLILRSAETAGSAGGKTTASATATAQPTSAPKPSPTVAPKANPTQVPTTPPFGVCIPGFVWREALAGDHVCVTPQTRSQVQLDNQQAATRRSPGKFGPDTCVSGFVWREATPADHVCVTPQTRDQTAADSQRAPTRIQR
jgi:hypothetical protein